MRSFRLGLIGIVVGVMVLLAGLGLGCLPAQAATAVSFSPKVDYGVGSSPGGVTSADFNDDGWLDLAVANMLSNNVSVLLNKGDGTYLVAVNYPVGSQPWAIAPYDFDRNGSVDLAVTNTDSDNISILLGNGDGTFQGQKTVAVGDYPMSIDIGDFNRDSKMDLAVGNCWSENISILYNDGNGNFQVKGTYPAGGQLRGVTVADLNNDTYLDLATSPYEGFVSVYLGSWDAGNNDLVFGNYVTYQTGSSGAYGIVSDDFNGDNVLDLAVANWNNTCVSVLLGNGDGTYRAGVNYTVGTNPSFITSADLNLDGKIDLAVSNGGSGSVSVLTGNGDGSFQIPPINYGVGSSPYGGVASADYNRDGLPDLAVSNGESTSISVLTNNTPLEVAFDQATISVSEGSGQVVIPVSRTTIGTMNVNYYTVDGTATAGGDYTSGSGTLHFAEGESMKTISIPITDDSRGEAEETFAVKLCNVSSPFLLGITNSIEVTINDNDGQGLPGTIQFGAQALSTVENSEEASLIVERTEGDLGRVSIDYYTVNGTAEAGTDYRAASGTLIFGDNQDSAVIKVLLINDNLQEDDKTFTIHLYNVTGGASVGNPNEMTVTILDDESRPSAEVTGLNLTPGDGEISAAWTDPDSFSLAKIRLYIKPEGGDYGLPVEVDKGVQGYTFTGLINGRTYIVKVVTVCTLNLESIGLSAEAIPVNPESAPDLVVKDSQGSGACYSGGKVNVSFTVQNQGLALAGKCDVKVYLLAAEGDEPTNCIATKSLAALKPGKDKKFNLKITLPPGLTGDNIYLMVAADASNLIEENDDWNNRSLITMALQYPDLAFSAVPTIQGNLETGAKIAIQDIVINQGEAPSGQCEVTYYLWDGNDPASKVLLGKRDMAALKAGKTKKGKVKLTVTTIAPGTWHLLAIVDEANVVKEKDETNNQTSV